jgi:uncharacterized protein (DUF1778 family)
MSATTNRAERLNVRLSTQAREEITQAAHASGQDLTSFVIGAALDRARRVLLEERILYLSTADAEQLDAVLDNPPEPTEFLRRLMRES